jgi:hypothetical protein
LGELADGGDQEAHTQEHEPDGQEEGYEQLAMQGFPMKHDFGGGNNV